MIIRTENPKFILIDSYNIICRSYYGLPLHYSPINMPINAVDGWLRTLINLNVTFPNHILVCAFDNISQRKVSLSPEYKSSRQSKPNELKLQIPFIKRLTTLTGIPTISIDNEEADDILASLAYNLYNTASEILIFSNDKDLTQCVNNKTFILRHNPLRNSTQNLIIEDSSAIYTRIGVKPTQIVDYLTIVGDNSDCIKGVVGVGPKTGSKLLNQYVNIQGIYQNLNSISPTKLKPSFLEYKPMLDINRQLIELRKDIVTDIEPYFLKPDLYQFSSLLSINNLDHLILPFSEKLHAF